MKRAIILHGWEGHPDEAWIPWLKSRLEGNGFAVETPQMPDTDKPTLGKWLPFLEEVIGNPDDGVVLIGHSLANITFLRYLEGLPDGARVGKVVMVAGFTDKLGYKELESFFLKPIDWIAIKKHCDRFVAIQSDNDPYVPLKHGDVFKEMLGASVVIEHGKGHMGASDNAKELRSVLEAVTGA